MSRVSKRLILSDLLILFYVVCFMFYLLVCVCVPMEVRKGHCILSLGLCCCVNVYICGIYVQVCILVCMCIHAYKLNEVVCCSAPLLPLRKSFSLSLKLGWQSTSPRDITVSTFHRARLVGVHVCVQSCLAFLCGYQDQNPGPRLCSKCSLPALFL